MCKTHKPIFYLQKNIKTSTILSFKWDILQFQEKYWHTLKFIAATFKNRQEK